MRLESLKIPPPPHSWRLTPRRAIALQRRLCGLVSQEAFTGEARFIAGLDGAFTIDGQQCIAGVVLWDLRNQSVVEQHIALRRLRFPYIPGLLSFRELPAWLAAFRKLERVPDLLMCDGQGLAHPRRFGIASHIGVLCGLPTIGCAKSRLVGTHTDPRKKRGARVPLYDKEQRIGTVLRTQTGVRPLYVSVGHRLDLATAEEVVLRCAVRYRLPEPTRLADRLVAQAKRGAAAACG